MNEILRNLTIQNLRNFINSFEETKNIFWDQEKKRLRHSGEFGTYREEIVKRWIRVVIPEKFGISSGFLISEKGSISSQCDIIIYDKSTTPKIENIDNQRFFPVETVSCVGEVKSDISSIAQLNKYLIKLSEIKAIREEVDSPSPYHRPQVGYDYSTDRNPFDSIFTFLICNKFNFAMDTSKINYETTPQKFKCNLALSLHDGILNYRTLQTPNLSMPFIGKVNHAPSFLANDEADLPCHVVSFLISIHQALNLTTLLNIDMAHYLTNNLTRVIK